MKNRCTWIGLFTLLFLLTIAGCGDGGGDSTTDTTNNSPPSISPVTPMTFTAVANGPLPESQSLNVSSFSGDELTVSTPSGTIPTWLDVVNADGRTSAPLLIDISVNTTALTPGTYTTTLRFNNVRTIPTTEVLGYQDITVTYTVQDVLSVDTNTLTFNVFSNSTAASDIQTVNLYGSNLAWSATPSDGWLQLSATSGTAPGTLDVNIAAIGSTLSAGTYNGTISLASESNNEIINVTLNVEPQRLFVPDKAVALTSLPSRSKLTEVIPININGGSAVSWSATDDALWLTLDNTTGTTGTGLSVTADPTGLADGLHHATITVSSSDAGISNTENIRVALYVSSTDAASNTIPYNTVVGSVIAMETDPLRPYLYFSNGGNDISIYHVYTGELVNTITIASAAIHDFAVDSTGSTLFVSNKTDASIAVLDLDTQTVTKTFTADYFTDCGYTCVQRIQYAEPNGYPILITTSLVFVDALDGTLLTTMTNGPFALDARQIAVSPGQEALFVAASSSSLNEYHRYQLGYSRLSGGGVYFSRTHLRELSGIIVGFDVTPNSSHLCVSRKTTTGINCLNSADLSDQLDLPLSNSVSGMAIDGAGNIYGSFSTYPSLVGDNVEHYSADGTLQPDTYDAGEYINDGMLEVSGDDLRLIVGGGTISADYLYFYDTAL